MKTLFKLDKDMFLYGRLRRKGELVLAEEDFKHGEKIHKKIKIKGKKIKKNAKAK